MTLAAPIKSDIVSIKSYQTSILVRNYSGLKSIDSTVKLANYSWEISIDKGTNHPVYILGVGMKFQSVGK